MVLNSGRATIAGGRLLIICFILLAMPWTNVSADSEPNVEITVTPEQEYYDIAENETFRDSVSFRFKAFDTDEANSYQIRIALYEEYEVYGQTETNRIISAIYTNLDITLSLSSMSSEWENGTNYSVFAELSEKPSGGDEYTLVDSESFSFTVGEEPELIPITTLENVAVKCDDDWQIIQNETRLDDGDQDFILECTIQNDNEVKVNIDYEMIQDKDAGIEFDIDVEDSSIEGNGSTTNFTLEPKDWDLGMVIPNGSISLQVNISSVDGWLSNQTIFEINYTVIQETPESPPPEPAVILGCMDSKATNFNPNATTDDGSCVFPPPPPPSCPMCNLTLVTPSQVSVDTPANFSADATMTEGWDYYGGGTISWGFDGIIVNGAEVVHTYTSVPVGGMSNVTVCVQFIDGPENCEDAVVMVNQSLSGYISHSSQLEPASSDAVGAIHFSIDAWGGLAPYSYEWRFDDGSISTNQSFVHEFFENGTQNVILEVTDGRGDVIELSAQVEMVEEEGNETAGADLDEVEEISLEPEVFGIAITGGGALFLSSLMYANSRKKREQIMKEGQRIAQESSSNEASLWDD